MSVLSWLGLQEDPEQVAANKAGEQKVAEGRKAAIALSNYRQSSRNQYNKLLNAKFAPYAGVNSRMAAAGLSGMHADLSPEANPVTLRDTGVGAAQGSNYLGWDDAPTGGGVKTHHTGIAEYLNGTALAPTTPERDAQLDAAYQNWMRNGGAHAQNNMGSKYRSSRGDQHVVDVEGGMPTGTGEGIPTFRPGGDQPKGVYTPNEYYSRQQPPMQQQGNAPLMSAGRSVPTSFFPQRRP